MDNLLVFIIMGLFVYLIFFRKGGLGSMGGMGCCGGHTGHGDHPQDPGKRDEPSRKGPPQPPPEEVIDLSKDQYAVLNPSDEKPL